MRVIHLIDRYAEPKPAEFVIDNTHPDVLFGNYDPMPEVIRWRGHLYIFKDQPIDYHFHYYRAEIDSVVRLKDDVHHEKRELSK
jgi:hypothetical protein